MADVEIRINKAGIEELKHSEIAAFIERLAIQVESAAKGMAPVDTGRLRSSITHSAPEFDASGVFAYVGSDVEYAIYQEFGTRYMAAQPFLRPALGAAKP